MIIIISKITSAHTNLFRVIDITQNEYGMPTKPSPNRYVPYESDRYKGKRYIYVQGDTDEEKNIFMFDTTDITFSSSESEYEEIDTYISHVPKYKTLIEVVLEPSKRDTQSGDIPSDDTPRNKFTDNEWNQLKHDFISQYIEHVIPDVPTELPLNTQPNTLHHSMDEKPFITSIQDRFLDTGHEAVTYNINWNIPENINRTTNIMGDPKYVSSNYMHTGVHLINNSLKCDDKKVHIYGELLKRKENELYRTNHKKKNHTIFNRVTSINNKNPLEN
ncbi:hypothetical protein PFAG_03837 [Plasmodium falciparum Santa Lucia]|uniref:Plasmodium falciparum erythrocyte membrane protein 1 acidic terminal segment domain-containing protein n=3 Tax=Plasmodium falciparum TaxID=5833 RepID=W4J0Y4_PLAFP|nr:hypothetical protein PFNF135_03997 [Plasmodium falciparum NF135/5.C10]ETW55870.1 hypothetical protein PFUGPA_01915 [Plasmodium falciparum Palo Alto/Uganda]EUT82461.1 hypothetical protein PFAG_03837 [Plasmodium falciparum Santa Lucia]